MEETKNIGSRALENLTISYGESGIRNSRTWKELLWKGQIWFGTGFENKQTKGVPNKSTEG